MSDNLERLRDLAAKGDQQAAAELVACSYEKIFAYFRRLCGNETEAADLTQKTFLKVWTALPSCRGRSSFHTWLHAIAHHVYVDWRRQPRRADERSDAWWETQPAGEHGPFESVMERDLARGLYRAVDQLDDVTRELVHLHYYQGLTLNETAEVSGMAVSTVKYRLRGALDALRSRLVLSETPLSKEFKKHE